MKNERFTIADAKDFIRKGNPPMVRVLANQLVWEMGQKDVLLAALHEVTECMSSGPVATEIAEKAIAEYQRRYNK